ASVPSPSIIVVDNASSDGTPAIARAHPGVTLLETGANLGFGRANNIGIALALEQDADYVFILNQDAHVAPDAIALLVAQARRQEHAGILCPMQLDDSGRALDPTFLLYYLAPNAPGVINDALLASVGDSYPVAAAPAAAWLFSRAFLTEVGGFDPLFFMYCEDDDLCSRARHFDYAILIVPAAKFYHCRGFHAEVRTETTRRKLQRKTSRLRSVLVRDAKRPEGSFAKNAWQSCCLRLFEGLGQLFAHRDWIACLAAVLAIVRIMPELAAIRKHRAICLGRGPHWLPLKVSK
ncbi:MAG TPA: glycosyltransferase family 2 protein, partial [Telluria sp.]|nr:glycosyltransferase family 2 protein [Telluria sp.]